MTYLNQILIATWNRQINSSTWDKPVNVCLEQRDKSPRRLLFVGRQEIKQQRDKIPTAWSCVSRQTNNFTQKRSNANSRHHTNTQKQYFPYIRVEPYYPLHNWRWNYIAFKKWYFISSIFYVIINSNSIGLWVHIVGYLIGTVLRHLNSESKYINVQLSGLTFLIVMG